MTDPVSLAPVTVTAKRQPVPDLPQYLRKAGLTVSTSLNPKPGDPVLDLSEMHFRFETVQEDEESPSNCSIRVYNLSADTVKQVRQEFTQVILQAGYQNANYGVIFQGTIRQFRIGRENSTTTYLDILASDGDAAYNFAFANTSKAAGTTRAERLNTVVSTMNSKGVKAGQLIVDATGGTLPRGKVLFGLAKGLIRSEVQTIGATWSIQNGEINIIPLDGYLPSQAVVLTSQTGLIGRPEQTQDGIRARCLINPKIIVGGLVRIDNTSINQTVQKDGQGPADGSAMLPYNQYAGIQQFASVSADGLYRVYVVEAKGDTRGHEWYFDLICLTVNPVTKKVLPYG